jgi:hypothetical protein
MVRYGVLTIDHGPTLAQGCDATMMPIEPLPVTHILLTYCIKQLLCY